MRNKRRVVSVNTDKHIASVVKEFWNDRVGFTKHIIGVTPKPNQAELLQALDREDFVAVKSGINTGKSAVQAWSILHYMSCRPECKILCTSPSKDQLYSVLWAELNLWHKKMNPIFRDMFVWTKTAFTHKRHANWFAHARTATRDNPQSLAGIHAKYVYRIIDEASAVFDDNFDVIEGATGTLETKELLCSNPTSLSGTFFNAFNRNKESYHRMTWNSLYYLQSVGGLVPDRVVERLRKKFGEDSNMWRVRVLGEFPTAEGDSYIPFDWVYRAIDREIASQKDCPIVFGVDPARYGADSTVIAVRRGDEFLPYHVLKNKSTMEVVGYVAHLANQIKPTVIFADSIGIGAGVSDRLEELGYPVMPINVAESPAIDGRKFKRLRDELWGTARNWFEIGKGKIWDNEDRDLLGELTSIKYKILSSGMIQIETKEELKKRGLASPNIADAHILTFAQPVNNYSKELENIAHYGEDKLEMAYALDSEAGY